jgi:hypothetical protein
MGCGEYNARAYRLGSAIAVDLIEPAGKTGISHGPDVAQRPGHYLAELILGQPRRGRRAIMPSLATQALRGQAATGHLDCTPGRCERSPPGMTMAANQAIA